MIRPTRPSPSPRRRTSTRTRSSRWAGRNTWLAATVAASLVRNAATVRNVRSIVSLRTKPAERMNVPPVTVVVPARNEAAVLHECLQGLRAQDYDAAPESGHSDNTGSGTTGASLRIVVVDDGSTDRTGEIAREHAERDSRVTVVRTEGPPSGWSGKVHALHVGVEAIGVPTPGEWLLFVDADVQLGPQALRHLLNTAESSGADLVSTPGGPPPTRSATWPLLMPQGLQIISDNASPTGRGRKAFAIGHCILVNRAYYEKTGGWSALHWRRNEDIAMATAVRDSGGTTRVVDGLGHVTTTGVDPFRQGWVSFRKSIVAGTGPSVAVLVGGGLAQIALSLAPSATVAVAVHGRHRRLAEIGALGYAAQCVAHWHTASLMRANPSLAPLSPLTGALFGCVLLDGAVQALRGATSWRGRG